MRGVREAIRRPISSLDQDLGRKTWLVRAMSDATRQVVAASRRTFATDGARRINLRDSQSEILIVVPPFASLYIPSLAAHTLQARAITVGIQVDVLYANILFAHAIGERAYNDIAWEPVGPFAAERIFARWAFDLPPLGFRADEIFDLERMFGIKQARVYAASMGLTVDGARSRHAKHNRAKIRRIERLERRVGHWLDEIANEIANSAYRIVGCTTTFEQTLCSVALLNRMKTLCPATTTIIGGANCEGEMAHGLASLSAGIDYVFSGESDETFPTFLRSIMSGTLPADRIIVGRPCERMDDCPTPNFQEFFDQRQRWLSNSRRPSEATYLTYETSRGCWWGQKQHCTFCGLNGEGMASRRKSPERVITELKEITSRHPTKNIGMADNIMPHEYFTTLLPTLSKELPGLSLFYEEKANMNLPQILMLKDAGIITIQPGIESLSSSLLGQMRKGVKAYQNLLLLRYGRIAGIRMLWALLCGFPGDEVGVYKETRRIVKLIHHLPPPAALWHLSIDRFSPYFNDPQAFGIKTVEPYPGYGDILPLHTDAAKIAYHFIADYDSAADSNLDVIGEIGQDISKWRSEWARPYGKRPELKIEEYGGSYLLIDTRGIARRQTCRELSRAEASSLLTHRACTHSPDEEAAVEDALAIIVDGWFIPLPVARIDMMFDLAFDEADPKRHRAQLTELGARRCSQDVKKGLVTIACNGPLSHLDHPLAPI